MKKSQYRWNYLIGIGMFLISLCLLLKYFNLTWIEMDGTQAKVTINFLVPMEQNNFQTRIQILGEDKEKEQIAYKVKWLNAQIVEIRLLETGEIKGLRAKMTIENAPTQLKGITKSEKVQIQFSVPLELEEAGKQSLISSTASFYLHFNTPVTAQELAAFIRCEAAFSIVPQDSKENESYEKGTTVFLLTPLQPLENGRQYTLSIQPGMRTASGHILMSPLDYYLQVDEKPYFTQTYPDDGDKWIGLYPQINFTSSQPITAALAKIDGTTLKATLIDECHGYFLLTNRLQPSKNYELKIQAKTQSGETSLVKTICFTTTSINRGWLEICCGEEKCIYYYEGNQKIKSFVCGIGKMILPKDYGTYYLQGKSEVYENEKTAEGANYWLTISDKIGIHGYIRDNMWQIKEDKLGDIGGRTEGSQILLSDEAAQWLYEKVTPQMMVIIRS